MAFQIKRGTNISHWLSQSRRRGEERAAFFTPEDIKLIADWGFDHIRLPIDEEQMWNDAAQPEPEAWKLMDSAIQWADRAGLKVIVDLHILRTHYFIPTGEPKLFTDPAEAQRFAGLWRQLSNHLRTWSPDKVAYELMNEAVATDPQDWNRVAMVAYQAIRQLEPDRTIVLGSNRWNQCATYDVLQIPDDRNTLLTFHYYNPMPITHYRASWCKHLGDYTGPIHYPGVPVDEKDLAPFPDPVRKAIQGSNKPYNRQQMIEDLAKPLAVRQRTGLPLHCGEFGVYDRTPQPIRLAWYRDFISVLNQFGIAWSNWDYKGAFGIVDAQRQSTGIAAALLGK